MEQILLDLLTRSLSEFTQMNADLAVAKQNVAASGAMAGDVTRAMSEREVGHREWSRFTPPEGRA